MTRPRFWTVGEPLVVLIPTETGPAEQCDHLRVRVGGAELNTAVGLSRLGHDVTFIGVVGDDPWGRRIVREMQAEGIEVRLRTDRSRPTGAYLRERRAQGLTRATYLRRGSAGAHLSEEDLSRLEPDEGDFVHLTGITPALSNHAFATWLGAAELARSRGAHLSLDINYRSALWSGADARRAFEKVGHLLSTVLAGTEEAALVSSGDCSTPMRAAIALLSELSKGAEIVIKDGASESLHRTTYEEATRGRAITLVPRDVVGAGDAFAAGYLSGSIDELTPAGRLERGHACAAFVVSTDGDCEGAPRRSELHSAATLSSLEVSR